MVNVPEFHAYNNKEFIKIITSIYMLKQVSVFDDEHLNGLCPFFKSNKLLKTKSIFNMPFNFYYSPFLCNYEEEFFDELENYSEKFKINIIVKSLNFYNYNNCLTSELNSILELKYQNYDDYFKSLSKGFRQNIRTAYNKLDSKFTLKKIVSEYELISFYNVMSFLYIKKHKMVFQPYTLFKSLFESNLAYFWAFMHQETGEVVSCIVVIKDKDILHYNWGVTNPKYYKYSLNTILVNELIKIAFKKDIKYIDFGATPNSDINLLFFKGKWGCMHYPVYYYYTLKKPLIIDLNHDYKLMRIIYSKLPKSFIRKIMPIIIPWLVN